MPGTLVGDGDARRLSGAAAAGRDDIRLFLFALSRSDSLVFRIGLAPLPWSGGCLGDYGSVLVRSSWLAGDR